MGLILSKTTGKWQGRQCSISIFIYFQGIKGIATRILCAGTMWNSLQKSWKGFARASVCRDKALWEWYNKPIFARASVCRDKALRIEVRLEKIGQALLPNIIPSSGRCAKQPGGHGNLVNAPEPKAYILCQLSF